MDPSISDELVRRARQISELLAALGHDHAFIGGMAMNVWAVPAPTFDLDLCAAIQPDEVAEVLKILASEGFIPPPSAWIESVGSARFQEFTVHWPFGLGLRPADIYLATDEFQRSALARRRRVEIEAGFTTDVVTPEDLLVYKLIAWRNKDRAGIDRLLAVQQTLDWGYVRTWARRFGVEVRLDEAMREAGIDPA